VAQQNFNFQELARQLGLKNISELPIVEAIQPTIVIGAADEIGPPMLPASAWAGGTQSLAAGERAYLQLDVSGSGGAFVEFFSSGGATQVEFRVDRDGVDPLTADQLPLPSSILPKYETGFGTTVSQARMGTSTVALNAFSVPTFFTAINFGAWGGPGFFIPSGGIFTLNNAAVATVGYFVIRWREVPAPALNAPAVATAP